MDRGVNSLNAWRERWLQRFERQLSTKVIHSTTTSFVVQKSTSTTPTLPHPGVVAELLDVLRILYRMELQHDSPGPIRRAAIESVLKEVT